MNIKAIVAGTILTALFAGTSAIAGDNDHFAVADYPSTTEAVVMQKVNYQAPSVDVNYDEVLGGRR